MTELNKLENMINEMYYDNFVDNDDYEELDRVGFNAIKNDVLYNIKIVNKKTLADYSSQDLYDIIYESIDRQLINESE